jgi:hypothetical protein
MSPRKTAGLGVLSCLAAAFALAGDERPPIDPDRPDLTNGPRSVAAGQVQVETGATVTDIGSARTLSVGEVLLRLGLGADVEVRLGLNSWDRTRDVGRVSSGWEDVTVGCKLGLWTGRPDRGLPALGVILASDVPSGSAGVGAGAPQPSVVLLAEWELGADTSLGVNLGWSRLREDGRRFDQGLASASLSFPLAGRTGAFVELYALAPENRGGPATRYVDAGLTYLIGTDVQLDVRLGAGLNDAAAKGFAGAGLSVRW